MSHRHFTLEDRNTIQNSLEDGVSRRKIAQKLSVSHTAVNEEIRNNSVVLEIVVTSRVNKPHILSLDLRTRRGKGEVPKKVAAQDRYQKRSCQVPEILDTLSRPSVNITLPMKCFL